MDDWLEEAKKIYKEIYLRELNKDKILLLKQTSELPNEVEDVTDFSIFHDYDGEVIGVLKTILEKAPNLEKISISKPLTWDEICALELGKIKELAVTVKDIPSENRIEAPQLRSLELRFETELTPIELMTLSTIHIDFVGMKNIERLTLRHWQLINPTDLYVLDKLKSLFMTGPNIDNLKWLYDAPFKLNKLVLDAELTSIQGIESQNELTEVCISHASINDIAPIEKLLNLQSLDLRYSEIATEGNLRKKDMKKLLISPHDTDIEYVKNRAVMVLKNAVREVRIIDKLARENNDLPQWQLKYYEKWKRTPFEERLKNKIWALYSRDIQRLNEEPYPKELGKAEKLAVYVEEATNRYPFLKMIQLTEEEE